MAARLPAVSRCMRIMRRRSPLSGGRCSWRGGDLQAAGGAAATALPAVLVALAGCGQLREAV